MKNIDNKIKNGTLVFTMTTNGYKYITLNLYKSIEMLKLPWQLVVIACDKESYNFFRREVIPVELYTKATSTNEMAIAKWGSPQFQKYNFMKLDILNAFAKNEKIQNCIYIDGDIVVYKDFLPDIISHLDAKPDTLLFQCDEKEPIVCTKSEGGCINCCTGFIAWRHGAEKGIFDTSDMKKWRERHDDQCWVNNELKEQNIPFETLPRNLYPNGSFIPLIKTIPEAFLLHFNYRVGNSKIMEMKKLGQWYVPYA